MRRILWAAALTGSLFGGAWNTGAWAADPGLYPGAKHDAEITRQAQLAAPMGSGDAVSVAVTSDSFEQVLAFYKAAGTEIRLSPRPGQPETGYERELPADVKGGKMPGTPLKVKQVVVLLDDAQDLTDSKNWVTIIRPFLFDVTLEGERFNYKDVRDITVILQSKQ